MSNLFFSELKRFKLADDEEALRDAPAYQQVRSEINRRSNPLSGGVDWETILTLCEELGKKEGFDLLLAVYYTVAAVKMQGLKGLSDGLELQAAVINHQGQESSFPAAKRIDLFNWMVGRIGSEVRALKPGRLQLRELYRCERACTALYELLAEVQPDNVPDLEAIGFQIFEHIDALEHPVIPEQKIVTVYAVNKLALCLTLVLGIALGIAALFSWNHIPKLDDSILVTSRIPKILTQQDGQELIDRFGSKKLEERRDDLAKLYADSVNTIINRPVGQELLQTIERSESLRHLYPEDLKIIMHTLEVKSWQQTLEEDLNSQLVRFQTARTRAANIKRLVRRGDLKGARVLSRELEQYAVSLSPLYGRTLYVEELLKNGDYSGAENELSKLTRSLNALMLKAGQLERVLAEKL